MFMPKEITALVQTIIESVKNTGIFIVRELRKIAGSTFSVKVTNPQEKVEVSGTVVIDQKEVINQLKNNALAIRELKKPIMAYKTLVWEINDVESGKTEYFGEETSDGVWRIRKSEKEKDVLHWRYATVKNNRTIMSYETAWEKRKSLNYGPVREA
jgi:hypothetical protein